MSRVNFTSSTKKMQLTSGRTANLTLPPGDRCYNFGGTDEYVRADGAVKPISFNDKPHSISVWFKTPAFTTPAYHALWSFTNTSDNNVRYWCSLQANGQIMIFGWKASSGRLWGSGSGLALSSANQDDNEWHHLLVTYNGSDTLKGYFDGGDPTSISVGAGVLIPDVFTIGARLVGGSSLQFPVTGKIAQLAIYDYELSSTKAGIVYNNGKCFNERELFPEHYYIFGNGPDFKNFPELTDLGRGFADGTATNMEAADIVADHP
tara:strand:+ start:35381 stop:36169 length:789 start_codon:yes stop_codon:yes gene_type:complete